MKLKIVGNDEDGLRAINAETGEDVEGVNDIRIEYSPHGVYTEDGKLSVLLELTDVAIDVEVAHAERLT